MVEEKLQTITPKQEEKEKPEVPVREVVTPASITSEKIAADVSKQVAKDTSEVVTITPQVKSEPEVIYRYLDGDDMARVRDYGVIVKIDGKTGKEKSSAAVGQIQKVFVVCGIKKAPFFSDVINEDIGITEEIFERRMTKEYRKIPITKLDQLVVKAKEYNKADFNTEDLQKN